MRSRNGLVGWLIVVILIVVAIGTIGDFIARPPCQSDCKERADRRFGPGWSPYKHVWEGWCNFACTVSGGPSPA